MELYIDSSLICLNEEELSFTNGGTFWGKVSGVFETLAGVADVVGGVALLAIPEPTTITKFAGAAAIGTGFAAIDSGIASILNN